MDLMLKAPSKEIMEAKLLDLGILIQQGEDLVEARKTSVVGGFTIWTTKPEYDEEGNVVVAGVASTDYHCNVRDLTRIIKDPTPFHEEDNPTGTEWGDVTWIDPTTVATPAMEWA